MNLICLKFGIFSLSNEKHRITFSDFRNIFTSRVFQNGRDIFKLWRKWRRRYIYDPLSLTLSFLSLKVPSYNEEGFCKKVVESFDLRQKISRKTGMKWYCMLQLLIQYFRAILWDWVVLTFFLLIHDILIAYHQWQRIKPTFSNKPVR